MNTQAGAGTSLFTNALIWFGAAVSIAEIEVGTQLASSAAGGRLGMVLSAILIGHLLGGFLLYLVSRIGGALRRSGMDCAKVPFGRAGGGFFAGANLLQLVGWTAVMIASGAAAAQPLVPESVPFGALCAGLGVLVALWIYIGLGHAVKINAAAMALLFVLTVALSVRVCGGGAPAAPAAGAPAEGLDFWAVLELSLAMPLSWLPLAADYAKEARRPRAAAALSAVVYTVTSCWMYGIGLAGAYCLGDAVFASILQKAGLGIGALIIVVFSTTTTTFLDAYSAGESAKSLVPRVHAKLFGVLVCGMGVALAVWGVMDRYFGFLLLIASVFAPMVAVQLTDWFLVGGRASDRRRSAVNAAGWLVGFAVYHLCLGAASPIAMLCPAWEKALAGLASPLGASLPAMVCAAAVPACAHALRRGYARRLSRYARAH